MKKGAMVPLQGGQRSPLIKQGPAFHPPAGGGREHRSIRETCGASGGCTGVCVGHEGADTSLAPRLGYVDRQTDRHLGNQNQTSKWHVPHKSWSSDGEGTSVIHPPLRTMKRTVPVKTSRGVRIAKLFYFTLFTLGLGGVLLFSVLYKFEKPRQARKVLEPAVENVDFRREIAAQLADIARELRGLEDNATSTSCQHLLRSDCSCAGLEDNATSTSCQHLLKSDCSCAGLEDNATSTSCQHLLKSDCSCAGLEVKIAPRLLLKLNAMVAQLDQRYALSDADLLNRPQPPSNSSDGQQSVPDVCGETYKGADYGYPFYQEGFVPSPTCDRAKKRPISDLVTILLSSAELPRLESVLAGIRGYHSHLPVIIAVPLNISNRTEQLASRYRNVRVLQVRAPSGPGRVWNELVDQATTPYVLIGRGLTHFNSYARLERQIYVISSSTSVVAAGGAFRNLTGHWKVGCYQSEIRNYYLRYLEGYRYSAQDCMICDHLEGPFVARTRALRETQFHGELRGDVVFEDWFLHVKYSNNLAVNCPDVMYFVQGGTEKSQESWLALAKEWSIHRIFLPPNIIYLFSCKEVGLSCDPRVWVRSYLLPTCCLVQVAKALKAIDDFATERGLRYELRSGSVLGAVKLRSFMPWDIDGDVTFDQKDYVTFYKNKQWFRDRGLRLEMFVPATDEEGAGFVMKTPDINYDWRGGETLSSVFLASDVRETATRVNVLGLWVRCQSNPGLYARNCYGPNYLRHAHSWRYLGMKSYKDLYVSAGSWLTCPNKSHHACLEHYPVDGSLHFVPQTVR
uniref:LicD/FKTN/FKRP nucleotidyltransferase domain-containing protein n=1 Tax=Timema cristinae TaxID=61476 RepID=A0A7R9H042_TIMCR|nr:unnamed protein product [Timema cristinae]